MNVQSIPVKDLIPDPNNARAHESDSIASIAASLERFGQRKPIVVRNNVVIAGNGTLAAARQLGWERIDAVLADDMDQNTAIAYAIADNRTAEKSTWDEESLRGMMRKLTSEDSELAGASGFGSLSELSDAIKAGSRRKKRKKPQEQSLVDEFVLPPFTVLDSRQAYWTKRRAAWRSMGLSAVGDDPGDPVSPHQYIPGYYTKLESGMTEEEILREYEETTDPADRDTVKAKIFDPVLAEACLSWFSGPGDRVVDPFLGDGVRGCVSGLLGRDFVGFDLQQPSIEHLSGQFEAVSEAHAASQNVTSTYEWPDPVAPKAVLGDSEKLLEVYKSQFDFGFWCPPPPNYRGATDKMGLGTMKTGYISTYASILQRFTESLKPGGIAVVVIAEPRAKTGEQSGLISETVREMLDLGMELFNEAVVINHIGSGAIRAGRDFRRGRKLTRTHQTLLTFSKGYWRDAVSRLPGFKDERSQ